MKQLVNIDAFKKGDYANALRQCFHRMDIMLEDKSSELALRKYRRIPSPSDRKSSNTSNGNGTNTGEGGTKKKLNEAQAIQFFKKLMVQEEAKKSGKQIVFDDDDDAEDILFGNGSNNDDDNEDDANFDPNEVEDYVPNQGPPSIRATGSDNFSCNLADHRVTAGCTSVVVFRHGKHLICANAGDSRAVLCRKNGICLPLSEDHKPSQDIERKRIEDAGGFINDVGRVNGNLNLTRSLGDLKYKQVPNVARADQIITGEPDITVTELTDDDEFIFLACDGVWDCMTSQEAVTFVRDRLNKGQTATDVVKEVFNFCISEDPRKTQGIGGDNMTAVIVKLK